MVAKWWLNDLLDTIGLVRLGKFIRQSNLNHDLTTTGVSN